MTAKQIKALREALDLTQQNLADIIAATQVTVARWETGMSRPTGAYLKALKDLAHTATNKQNLKRVKQLQVVKKSGLAEKTRIHSNVRKTKRKSSR
jgi:transcriptional regulator with XRE-family HTH domain